MLVLSRKEGQSILIGDNIRVEVSRIEGDKVRIAIDAPREVRVDREEVRRLRLQDEPPLVVHHGRVLWDLRGPDLVLVLAHLPHRDRIAVYQSVDPSGQMTTRELQDHVAVELYATATVHERVEEDESSDGRIEERTRYTLESVAVDTIRVWLDQFSRFYRSREIGDAILTRCSSWLREEIERHADNLRDVMHQLKR